MLQIAEPDEVQEYMMSVLNGLFSGCALRYEKKNYSNYVIIRKN